MVEKEVPADMQDLMEKKQGELIGLNHLEGHVTISGVLNIYMAQGYVA